MDEKKLGKNCTAKGKLHEAKFELLQVKIFPKLHSNPCDLLINRHDLVQVATTTHISKLTLCNFKFDLNLDPVPFQT